MDPTLVAALIAAVASLASARSSMKSARALSDANLKRDAKAHRRARLAEAGSELGQASRSLRALTFKCRNPAWLRSASVENIVDLGAELIEKIADRAAMFVHQGVIDGTLMPELGEPFQQFWIALSGYKRALHDGDKYEVADAKYAMRVELTRWSATLKTLQAAVTTIEAAVAEDIDAAQPSRVLEAE